MDFTKYDMPACMVCPVRTMSIFDEVEITEIEDINVTKRVIPFKRKQTIFQANSMPSGVHIIHLGKVKFTKVNSLGVEQIIGFGKRGDIFGYDSLLSEKDYHYSATALEDCVICFIPKEKIISLIKRDGSFALKLFKKGFTEFGAITNNYSDMVHKPLRQKVAMALMMIKEAFGLSKDDLLDARLSREEIANLALTTTASSIRTLSDFNKEGLIEIRGKDIAILDIEKLQWESVRY